MKIGVSLSGFAAAPETANVVDRAVELGAEAEALGLHAVWFGQMFSYDAVALASLVGRETSRILVGTSVVPIYPRHPQLLASAAKTAQAATRGRFQLGVGLGARTLLESAYGVPFPSPAPHLREYLLALRPLLAGEQRAYEGETVVSRPPRSTEVAGAHPTIPLLVAAMGPRALAVTGELADGTLPFLAGPRALAEHIVPTLHAAAEHAGRPRPRVVVAVPAVVTDDVELARTRAAETMAFYDAVPSYQRVLEREGVEHAADLLAVGDEKTVAAQLNRYFDAGATEITVTQTDLLGEAGRERTWALAGDLAR